jgi:hypothetical protein
MPVPISESDMQRIRAAVLAGRKIEAIKLYREASGQGLKESKDFVDGLELELRTTNPGDFTAAKAGGGCAGVIVSALGLVGLLAWALGFSMSL